MKKDERPTLILLVTTYVSFLLITAYTDTVGLVASVALLSVVIALHSSLQHEVLHGHPFQSVWLSDLTVFPAIGFFVPYLRFKDTHLQHHYDPKLTDPYEDPETNFFDPAVWQSLPAWLQRVRLFNNTLVGRILVGPAISMLVFYRDDLLAMLKGNRRILASYALHLAGLVPVLLWLSSIGTMPIWAWALAAYSGMSFLKIRTFLEHRAHDRAAARSVIIEDRSPLALLFLNNNYHAVHHAHPKVIWHQLPAKFEAQRDVYLRRNGNYTYRSYASVAAHFLFKIKDPVAHPLWTRHQATIPANVGQRHAGQSSDVCPPGAGSCP